MAGGSEEAVESEARLSARGRSGPPTARIESALLGRLGRGRRTDSFDLGWLVDARATEERRDDGLDAAEGDLLNGGDDLGSVELHRRWERRASKVEESVEANVERVEELNEVSVGSNRNGARSRAARSLISSLSSDHQVKKTH